MCNEGEFFCSIFFLILFVVTNLSQLTKNVSKIGLNMQQCCTTKNDRNHNHFAQACAVEMQKCNGIRRLSPYLSLSLFSIFNLQVHLHLINCKNELF